MTTMVLVGLEPTSVYHENLAYHLHAAGYTYLLNNLGELTRPRRWTFGGTPSEPEFIRRVPRNIEKIRLCRQNTQWRSHKSQPSVATISAS